MRQTLAISVVVLAMLFGITACQEKTLSREQALQLISEEIPHYVENLYGRDIAILATYAVPKPMFYREPGPFLAELDQQTRAEVVDTLTNLSSVDDSLTNLSSIDRLLDRVEQRCALILRNNGVLTGWKYRPELTEEDSAWSRHHFEPILSPQALDFVTGTDDLNEYGVKGSATQYNVLVGIVILEEITAIGDGDTADPGSQATAIFTYRVEPTPFTECFADAHRLRSENAQAPEGTFGSHEGRATFARYDTGWRLENIQLNQ